jgi:hypothetical protein
MGLDLCSASGADVGECATVRCVIGATAADVVGLVRRMLHRAGRRSAQVHSALELAQQRKKAGLGAATPRDDQVMASDERTTSLRRVQSLWMLRRLTR